MQFLLRVIAVTQSKDLLLNIILKNSLTVYFIDMATLKYFLKQKARMIIYL